MSPQRALLLGRQLQQAPPLGKAGLPDAGDFLGLPSPHCHLGLCLFSLRPLPTARGGDDAIFYLLSTKNKKKIIKKGRHCKLFTVSYSERIYRDVKPEKQWIAEFQAVMILEAKTSNVWAVKARRCVNVLPAASPQSTGFTSQLSGRCLLARECSSTNKSIGQDTLIHLIPASILRRGCSQSFTYGFDPQIPCSSILPW